MRVTVQGRIGARHADMRIPTMPGQRSDASEAIVPVYAGPLWKRSVDFG
jgi:hypothetical protein